MSNFVNTIDIIGDEALTSIIIDRSITEYKDNTVKYVGRYAFFYCEELQSIDLPLVTSADRNAFYYCKKLVSVELKSCNQILNNCFYGCAELERIILPSLTLTYDGSFRGCTKLELVDLPVMENIASNTFRDCSALKALILRSSTLCILANTYALYNSSIKSGGTGFVYVPSALVESYKTASNWSTVASQFRALEDYTVDGTITGELDPTKI